MAFKQAVAAVEEHLDAPTELWSTGQRLDQLERIEQLQRMLPALAHELINELATTATVSELGGRLPHALAKRLRINRGEAARRIEEAADLGPRSTLTGEPSPASGRCPQPPRLEATAAGQAAGLIGGEQVRIIRGCLQRLPCWVDEATRVEAERQLARVATRRRPDELKRFAEDVELRLNPDGTFTDEDRARRRGLTVGPQGPDGMSRVNGYLTPEARAGWEAMTAKWAAPGMCNPADEEPIITGTPSQEAIDADARSAAQRNHDAFNALVRNALMSGQLGEHNGVPVSIIATAALADLQAKTGRASTATGGWLPITDAIRMGAQANNFLLLFDQARGCELYKGRSTRCATPAQRLVLYATERGCSRPGCDVPAAWCQVHREDGVSLAAVV